MRFIPEYSPARKLILSFVDQFYNQRFHYGRAQAQIIRACRGFPVEMRIEPGEMDAFRSAAGDEVLALPNLSYDFSSPGTAIMLEAAPIFAEEESGRKIGLVFRNPFLEDPESNYNFSRRLAEQYGFIPLDLGFGFSTAELLVNEDVVLLSAAQFNVSDDERKMAFFQERFPGYHFHIVPPLCGDTSNDLDMYLWPVAPKVWIVSKYPEGSPQEHSISPALGVLVFYGHTVHRVPGLEPLIYDDINAMPNYTNGIILNQLALVPAYHRQEDVVVVEILQRYGFRVVPVDCRDIILSNSAIHCISTVIPG